MNSTLLAKILGWGQFAFQVLGQVFSTGIPTTPLGWLTVAASLATAVGMHAAANSPGIQPGVIGPK